jgi:hypothetical protein
LGAGPPRKKKSNQKIFSLTMGEVSTFAVATAVTVIALVWKWSKRSNGPDRTEIPRGVLKAGILQTPGAIALPCTSTYEMLEVGKKASNNGPFLRDSNENWITYQDCIDQTLRIAAGLHALGGVDKPGTKIGIFAPNWYRSNPFFFFFFLFRLRQHS